MSGDVLLHVVICLRVDCNEGGGNGGCCQPQGVKMQIAPEDLFQSFRKRFRSLGTDPDQYAKDTRCALYASCKSQAQSWDLQTPTVELSPSVHHCGLTQAYAHGL